MAELDAGELAGDLEPDPPAEAGTLVHAILRRLRGGLGPTAAAAGRAIAILAKLALGRWDWAGLRVGRNVLLSAPALAVATLVFTSIAAAEPASTPPASGLAIDAFPTSRPRLRVSSPAFRNLGDIPFENTMYRGDVFPGLDWTHGPYGTRSFAIIMQDADVRLPQGALLHWSMYALPAGVSRLAAGMTAPPPGASFGPSFRGPNHAYLGPHTPPGPKHHYHFQVFALDRDIAVDPTLKRDGLIDAMTGHVLASGEVIGLGQAPPDAPPLVPATPSPPSGH
jgi:para-nitrobenzyl esterase